MIGFLIAAVFAALIITAVMIVLSRELATAVILFMGFGLGSTLLYVLFSAPDVALTEAVIGAGISSVVFLVALMQTDKRERE
ncbi:MAG: hydrogenase subunit MbhD domain-containing protein [Campylobacterota bacterium]|nr:hydrogenase subunit MbhD domain-containing protein [Campylobacterota bacterium]